MDLYKKYLDQAVYFLSFRSRSEKEVRDNLQKKLKKRNNAVKLMGEELKEHEEAIEKVIAFLKEQRFINDVEFAKLWLESRSRSKPKSLQLIKMELRQKGVASDIIEAVAVHPETETGSDYDRAKKLAEKKFPRYKHLPKQEIYQKLGGVLARNGFNWEIIKRSIDDILRMGYNNE